MMKEIDPNDIPPRNTHSGMLGDCELGKAYAAVKGVDFNNIHTLTNQVYLHAKRRGWTARTMKRSDTLYFHFTAPTGDMG